MLKKWKKGALLAPALLAVALAFFACKNIDDGEIQQPPAPEQGANGGSSNQGGEQKPSEGGNLGGEQNPDEGENPVPTLEYVYEVDSVSMPNEDISPKRVSEILGELFFDYTMTHLSTGTGYLQNYVPYENLPEEIKREIKFKETAENGSVERTSEYEFPEDQKEIPFEIWHGGKSLFAKTLKNGNYNRAAITRKIIALLKEIIGEASYDAISADVAAGNLTLTAEKIKALGDFFPALEKDAEAGKEAKDAENAAVILQNKEAFVAQAEGAIEVRFGPEYPDWYEEYPFLFDEETAEKKYVVAYKKGVVFDGEFNLDEISLPDNNGKGTFADGATLKGTDISINKLNTIRGDFLPTLKFSNVKGSDSFLVEETSFYLYKLYKDYSDNLGKLKISGNMSGITVNAAKDKDGNFINGYTLFTDDDKAKESSDPSIKSLTIDALIKMYEQFKIHYFVNMIISGKPKEATEVENWNLTNIVFEDNMSDIKIKITNDVNGGSSLFGIVYFKSNPYKNIDRTDKSTYQFMYGLLKLDSLDGVSYDNFGINLGSYSTVLDVRGVDKSSIDNYNKNAENYGIVAGEGYSHAIYFSKEFNNIKNDQSEIKALCYKFSRFPGSGTGFINAYLGEDRVNGESYNTSISKSVIGAKNPRKLKEFEYFGNSFENNGIGEYKFEKTAKQTYEDANEFENLSTFDQDSLKGGYLNKIAQTNRSHFCVKAKSVV